MGYPMSFRRFVNRSGLAEGGYMDTPHPRVNLAAHMASPEAFNAGVDFTEVMRSTAANYAQEIERLYRWQGILLGDLRRLEHDAMDEQAICVQIAARTGVDREVVAAVLKEFISW
jgi:hypothetical protein